MLKIIGLVWGCPSCDLESLIVMTELKFLNVIFDVKYVNSTDAFYKVPYFCHENKTCYGINQILNFYKEKIIKDELLLNLVMKDLYHGLMYIMWISDTNYHTVTKPALTKNLSYFQFLYPFKTRKFISNLFRQTKDEYEHILQNAINVLQYLSETLNERQYFGGNRNDPDLTDAYIFAHLAILNFVPLVTGIELKDAYLSHKNLVNYVDRIMKTFYAKEYEQNKNFNHGKKEFNAMDWPNKTRDKYLWALFVCASMGLYAFTSGIVRIEFAES